MMVKNFKELIVWQKSMDAAKLLYTLVQKLPREEMFAMSDQMRRCAISIPSNIAEGQQRKSIGDFSRFIHIAQGSRAELETQLLLCVSIGYLCEEEISELMGVLDEMGKMLSSLDKSLPETI